MEIKAENHMLLVHSIARKVVCPQGVDYEDIVQIGCIGLIKAIQNFDTSYNVKFSTYAFPMIQGEIKKYLRDNGVIKINRKIKTLINKVRYTSFKLGEKLNREPSVEELANELEEDNSTIEEVIKASQSVRYLYDVIYQNDTEPILLIDQLSEKNYENREEDIVNNLMLKNAIENLDEKSKSVMQLRYIDSRTQIETARILGVSQVQISRIERKVINELKERFTGGLEVNMSKINLVFNWLDRNYEGVKERKELISQIKQEFEVTQSTAISYLTAWKKKRSEERVSTSELKTSCQTVSASRDIDIPKQNLKGLKVTNLSVSGENGEYMITKENISLFDGDNLIIAFRNESELDGWYEELKSLFSLKRATIA